MMRHLGRAVSGVLLLLSGLSAAAAAQEAVTITGHVRSGSTPLRGADVTIPEFRLGAVTDAEGYYSLIVPSTRVRGQSVTLSARRLRFETRSVQIVLTGGSLVRDFDLVPTQPQGGPPSPTARGATPATAKVAETAGRSPLPVGGTRQTVDSAAFEDLAGPTDLPNALEGKLAGLQVAGSPLPGASSPIVLRGPRSVLGTRQPLLVVDGIPLDDANVTDAAQRFGRGGFDYGTPLQDIDVADIASVSVLDGPAAAAAYGGRAANGVILLTLKSGRGLNGFGLSASRQMTRASLLRLPSYQNSYGQGLGGVFEFFNGRGNVLNDSVAQSWGPALRGQPVAQASLTEPRRADVRPWLPQPDNVHDYFSGGETSITTVGAQGSSALGNFRLAVSSLDGGGLEPTSAFTRRNVTLAASTHYSERLSATGSIAVVDADATNRPGTGDNEANPMAAFSRFGRQIDVAALRQHVRTGFDYQISWNYAGHDNPWFQPLANSNHDHRTHWIGGASVTYALTPTLDGTFYTNADAHHDTRRFDIAGDWMGGFPFYAGTGAGGTGSFVNGGWQTQDITAQHTNVGATLVSRRRVGGESGGGGAGGNALVLSAGGEIRQRTLDVTTQGNDRLAGPFGPDTTAPPPAPPARVQSTRGTTSAAFGAARLAIGDVASLSAAVRGEQTSAPLFGNATAVYPSLAGTLDLKRVVASVRGRPAIDAARLRLGLWRAGNELAPDRIQAIALTARAADSAAGAGRSLSPETTIGWELGTDWQALGDRLGASVTLYGERSADVVLSVPALSGTSAVGATTGTISNAGIETWITVVPVRHAGGLEWSLALDLAHNGNSVTGISGGGDSSAVALGPSRYGVALEARRGVALGAIVGTGYLRDAATGELLLRDGLPLPDSVRGARVLGTTAPAWTGGLTNTFRLHGVELRFLVDARMGGRLFSASNLWGAYSGVLAETAYRPDSGLLVRGIDAASGKANTQHVSTEAYYHALGAIDERWVYSASFVKLREARLSYAVPLFARLFSGQTLRVSLIGRNLAMWAKVPNVDPESALSTSSFQGLEMGAFPATRSLGLQVTFTP